MFIFLIGVTLVEFAQVSASFVAVTMGLVALVRYILKRYSENLKSRTTDHPLIVELKEHQDALAIVAKENFKKLDNLIKGLDVFKKDLDDHMEVEFKTREEEFKVIQAMQKQLDLGIQNNLDDHKTIGRELSRMRDDQVEQALSVVKAMTIGDPTPTLLYKTTPGGYGLIWHNKAWEDWTGLSIEDTRAGGDILAVHPDDRTVIEPSVEETGQLKDEIDITYMMVRPKTGEKVGVVWAHGSTIHTANEDAWYYVSRLKMIKPEPNWEHLQE